MFVPSECAMAWGTICILPPVFFMLLWMYIAASTRFSGSAMPFISQMGSLNCNLGDAIAAQLAGILSTSTERYPMSTDSLSLSVYILTFTM